MVIKYGSSLKSSAFIIKFPLTAGRVDKIRVIVSAKISKKAVVRNKLKRQIKEAWRLLKIIETPAPHIYVKKMALEMSYQEIAQELKKVLKK